MAYKDKEKQKEYQRQWYNKKYSNPVAIDKKRQVRKQWREANKEKIKDYNIVWFNTEVGQAYINNMRDKRMAERQKRKNLITEIKQNSVCGICGEDHPATLDFHHTDPSTKLFNIGTTAAKDITIEALIEEINKCIILCANCHRKLHYTK